MKALSIWTLRLDAAFLMAFGLFGLVTDFRGYVVGKGALGGLLLDNPLTIGVAEAHGLALIVAAVLLRNAALGDRRFGHTIAVATHLLLGLCNLIFWRIFSDAELVVLGVVSTALHGLFILSNGVAVRGAVSAKPA